MQSAARLPLGPALNLPFELRIGLRYTRAGATAFSRLSPASRWRTSLGVMALIVVLSVMNGFTKEVRGRMLSVLSHVDITSFGGALPDWLGVAARARKSPEVITAVPYANAQAMLARSDVVRGALGRIRRHHHRAHLGVGRQHAVQADQMQPRPWHQGGQALHELQRPHSSGAWCRRARPPIAGAAER